MKMMGRTGSAAQLSTWWRGIPVGTRCIFLVNVGLYIIGLCLPRDWTLSARMAPAQFCMSPQAIWRHPSEIYRMVTAAFLHANLMHIAFNMFTFVQVSITAVSALHIQCSDKSGLPN